MSLLSNNIIYTQMFLQLPKTKSSFCAGKIVIKHEVGGRGGGQSTVLYTYRNKTQHITEDFGIRDRLDADITLLVRFDIERGVKKKKKIQRHYHIKLKIRLKKVVSLS